jgi:hypothetical protein
MKIDYRKAFISMENISECACRFKAFKIYDDLQIALDLLREYSELIRFCSGSSNIKEYERLKSAFKLHVDKIKSDFSRIDLINNLYFPDEL